MTQRKSLILAAITAMLLCPLSSQLNAVIGVSNLDVAATGSIFRSANQFLAAGFTTDSSAAQFSLEEVTLPFNSNGGTINDFTVSIYTNSGINRPDTLVGTLAGTTSPPSLTTSTFTNSSLLLNANTTYWITWGFTDGTGDFTSPTMNTSSSTGDWDLTNSYAGSINAGSSWFDVSGSNMQFSVEASAIPEPSAAALLTALASLTLVTRRRRRRA